MARLRQNIPDLVYLLIIVGAFLFVGQRLFGAPATAGWETDFENTSIDLNDVVSGGVGRDGIPPIDEPKFAPCDTVQDLSIKSPVVSVHINGEARAYPLEVLTRHEIVNDMIGDVPIVVTFCPLCNSAVVYDRRVEGHTLRFGVSGNLHNSDLIMWDDRTESWWQQLTGEGIVGKYNGYQLEIIPSQVIGFEVFKERYPDGYVLRGPHGTYGTNPYAGYDSTPTPFLFRGKIDNRLFAMERVLAGEISGQPIAYPFTILQAKQVINDIVAGEPIVAFWQSGAVSALDLIDIDSSRDVGMAVMYSRQLTDDTILTFRAEDGVYIDDQTNSKWNFFGEAIEGELAGESLTQLNAFPHFWFAWAAFYPETALYPS